MDVFTYDIFHAAPASYYAIAGMGNISSLHPDQGDSALPGTHPAKGLVAPLATLDQ